MYLDPDWYWVLVFDDVGIRVGFWLAPVIPRRQLQPAT